MKELFRIWAVVFVTMVNVNMASSQVLPSDTTTLPYVVDEMVTAIKDCYEQPIETNQYAHFLSDEQDFPPFVVGQNLSAAEIETLKDWVKTHPSSIEKFLIRRKKNYDTYFNPAMQD